MIIDTAEPVWDYMTCLHNAGVTTVIRYLNRLNPSGSKVVGSKEVTAMANHGMTLGLVHEGWGGSNNFEHNDITAATGALDAAYALPAANMLGARPGAGMVYFAIDTDATTSEIENLVLPYFEAITNYNNTEWAGNWQIGVYGSGAVCRAVRKAGYASRAWLSCSMGWSNSWNFYLDNEWHMIQRLPSILCTLGVDVDVVASATLDCGFFVPSMTS